MAERYFYTSITRPARLAETPFTVQPLPREQWQSGDYVAGEVSESTGALRSVELVDGRMTEAFPADRVIGALGKRAATLEAVGDWEAIGDDLRMEAMTSAGLFGKVTSKSVYCPTPMSLAYAGHLVVDGGKLTMARCVPVVPVRKFQTPTILVVGTSMSAGKTTSASTIIRELKAAGLKVVAAKLTGAARYRDVLSMGDAGADHIFDFVDAGLPSTVCPPEQYRAALSTLLSRMAAAEGDAAVVEAGASPLEPYNGATAIRELLPNVRFTLLCASDPYAVVGVMQAFDRKPDLVAGGAANTDAAVELVGKLAGVKALDLQDRRSLPALRAMLRERLGIH
jgi:hypothetical protein